MFVTVGCAERRKAEVLLAPHIYFKQEQLKYRIL
jgi:hypothetical protein